MSSSGKFVVQDGQVYGRLQAGFQIELGEKGYFSIAGLNNSGKTTVLQWLVAESQNSIYIPAERGIVRPTLDSGTLQLRQYVDTFRSRVSDGPLDTVNFGRGSVGFGSTAPIRELDSYSECLLSSMIRDKGITDSVTELVLQSHLAESSRGKEGSLSRQQDLQDASPDPLFQPALIAAGDGRPGPEALGQFAPGRASTRDPEHAFYDQAMIDRRTPCRRLLWRQEWAHLLPVGIGEGRQSRQRDGSGQLIWHRWSLTRAAQDMKASGCRLVLTPKARPVQSSGLLLLRLADGV
jgi:hypothetical protein